MAVPVTAVLIVAGLQVPVIAGVLVDAEGNTGAALFWHSGPIAAKAGVRLLVIVISIVTAVEHCPASGVNM